MLRVWMVLFGVLVPSVLMFILRWNSSHFMRSKQEDIQDVEKILIGISDDIDSDGSILAEGELISEQFINDELKKTLGDAEEGEEAREALRKYLKNENIFNMTSEESAIKFRKGALEIGVRNSYNDKSAVDMWNALDQKWKVDPNEKGMKYFVYQPSGGWGNQRLILRWAMVAANAMERTLILPMMFVYRLFIFI